MLVLVRFPGPRLKAGLDVRRRPSRQQEHDAIEPGELLEKGRLPLRGDSPAVIPVYQVPIAYAINRKRAREIGVEMPLAVLLGAREVYD